MLLLTWRLTGLVLALKGAVITGRTLLGWPVSFLGPVFPVLFQTGRLGRETPPSWGPGTVTVQGRRLLTC